MVWKMGKVCGNIPQNLKPLAKKEIEFLNTKGVLLQKHLVILHLLVEFTVMVWSYIIKNSVNDFCISEIIKKIN